MAAKPPLAGELRANLRFERRTPGAKVGGVRASSWGTLIDQRRARVDPKFGGEEVIAARVAGKAGYTIWVRSDSVTRTLTHADRAVNNRTGEIYNLGQPVDPDGKRMWLMIDATSAGNADGEG